MYYKNNRKDNIKVYIISFSILNVLLITFSFFEYFNVLYNSKFPSLICVSLVLSIVSFIGFFFLYLYKLKYSVFFLIIDFPCILLYTVLFFIRIPSYLLNILLTIFTSILSGFFTLAGISITIVHNDNNRKRDEISKIKPLVFISDPMDTNNSKWINYSNSNIFSFNGKQEYNINPFVVSNGDFSYSCLKGICINEDIIMFEIAQVFEKNKKYYNILTKSTFNYSKKIKNIYLLLLDLMNNFYVLEVNFKFIKNSKDNITNINIISGIEYKRVIVDFEKFVFTEIKGD